MIIESHSIRSIFWLTLIVIVNENGKGEEGKSVAFFWKFKSDYSSALMMLEFCIGHTGNEVSTEFF